MGAIWLKSRAFIKDKQAERDVEKLALLRTKRQKRRLEKRTKRVA